jgi:hypothetical protein
MIHHLSISAQNPQHVAQVLAEILQGQPTHLSRSIKGVILMIHHILIAAQNPLCWRPGINLER